MVKVENISKRYGNHYAVKDLSFEIEKGQVYGFLGPNGAGKSTTMNIMTGYIAASEGKVEIDGHDILTDAEEAKKCIGYLPELPPLYMDMTVKEYLMFAAELKGIAKSLRKEEVAEVMERTFITDMAGRLIKNLSKGYRQRVGLAQALLGDPEVIILDEPTVGLDPKQINEIRDLIRSLKQDHAVILSSHILSEVAEVCDTLIVIAKGHMIASGTRDELLGNLGETNTIEITAGATKDEIDTALANVSNVKSVSYSESDIDGCINCIIVVNGSDDIRVEISKIFASNGIGVINMTANKQNLEDIFLQLTDDAYVDESIKNSEEDDNNKKKSIFKRKDKSDSNDLFDTENVVETNSSESDNAEEKDEIEKDADTKEEE